MTASHRYKRYLGVAVAVVVLGWWLQQKNAGVAEPQPVDARVPDHYFKGLVVTTMDATGKPSHRLEAEALSHYADDDVAELLHPRLTAFRDDGRVWQIKSDTAQAYEGATSLWLQGDVELARQPLPGDEAMKVVTQNLWVYPEREHASTDAAVLIQRGLNNTRGVGLRVDLKKGQLQLLANVKGSYVLESR